MSISHDTTIFARSSTDFTHPPIFSTCLTRGHQKLIGRYQIKVDRKTLWIKTCESALNSESQITADIISLINLNRIEAMERKQKSYYDFAHLKIDRLVETNELENVPWVRKVYETIPTYPLKSFQLFRSLYSPILSKSDFLKQFCRNFKQNTIANF